MPSLLRLGIFGGTFDPIHFGHLRMAEEIRDRFALERVLFVPNQVSPFKQGSTVTPTKDRVDFVAAAIAENPYFSLWLGELEREGPSYTVETLRQIAQEFPHSERFFLTGTDAIRDIGKWREPDTCLKLAQFVSVHRPGVTEAEARHGVPDAFEPLITFVAMHGLDISSTELRQRFAERRSVRYLVPDSVRALIEERGLYRVIE